MENTISERITSDSLDLNELLEMLLAYRKGDFEVRLPNHLSGIGGKIADALNEIIMMNETRVHELDRIKEVVATQGRLNQRIDLPGTGGWKAMGNTINALIEELTRPTKEITRVITAVARGDLSQTVPLEVEGAKLQGSYLRFALVVNTMVEQLNSFSKEVTRVAREVGTEGKLGGQALVMDVSGTWKDLTDSVNSMASNLTNQVRNIAEVTVAVASGDLSRKITVDVRGDFLELKDTINSMVDQLRSFTSEVTRVTREVGTQGKLGGQAIVPGAAGVWKELTDNVNFMSRNLTGQVRNIAQVTTAVANGDLNSKITVRAAGEILDLKNTINKMVDQLNAFASEVTRVAREVGTEGILGGFGNVPGVAGTWKDLTDSVNSMARNLTNQVRNIAEVTTAVARGDLSRKITVDASGEIQQLKETINTMVDQLNSFASEVTRVAREVGTEGRLGGQAQVKEVSGTWRDLTENVNQLASNLTTQVRAIAEVATAVTNGDLTRSIQVEARGEVESLKNSLNEMIYNLRESTQANYEQDWLKTNLALFTRKLQGERSLTAVAQTTLSELATLVNAQHGLFFITQIKENKPPLLSKLAGYAIEKRDNTTVSYHFGEGIVGQCALEQKRVVLRKLPGNYLKISSGLGKGAPANVVVFPVIFENQVKAVIELASFEDLNAIQLTFLDQLADTLGIVINTIESASRTEELLKQSQSLALELQSRQLELQQTNEQLEGKALLLLEQNVEVERKNHEIDLARKSLEEKAKQLTLTSKYKSEFLSNMSHELRTPLNSLLILSQQLVENREANLTDKQVSYAKTIRSSGNELLSLINDILDLSKIESGTVAIDLSEVSISSLCEDNERTFRHVASTKNVDFWIEHDPALPATIITDAKRLQQIIKNLLSNAFKFTSKGAVTLSIRQVTEGWNHDITSLQESSMVLAFSVKDTGIGIPDNKLKLIFEAFQQADGSTNRKYGGTGLGLSISRELANLLGGEIIVSSSVGKGSIFTLYLPIAYSESFMSPTRSLSEIARSDVETDIQTVNSPGVSTQPANDLAGSRNVETEIMVNLPVQDDRNQIAENDRVITIIEDDPSFVQILTELAHEKGFKVVTSSLGEEGIDLVKQYRPAAITLDIFLSDVEGWIVLDRLKQDPYTRYIPVYVISVDDQRDLSLHRGAFGHVIKPVSKETLESILEKIDYLVNQKTKKLLIIEDKPEDQLLIRETVGNGDVEITSALSGEEGLKLLEKERFDCVVLDLILPEMSGFEVLERIKEKHPLTDIPIIVYTIKELSKTEKNSLRKFAREIIIKDVRSQIRLMDEVNLFLHRKPDNISREKMELLSRLYDTDVRLEGKKVLIVDDDIRNIFALTSVLERYNMEVFSAENGRIAVELLSQQNQIDFVLMDIMMPEMDGYEAMSIIRKKLKMTTIPIIALTAKAMKGDREKCIQAGASGYIAKPVNAEQLLSLLRVWLFK